MIRIVVMNPKGGCGKTTLATNLASYFSNQGNVTTLMDLDPQGSSVFWAHTRPEQASYIQLVDAHNCPQQVTRSWAIQPPRNTDVLILDTPARPDLTNLTPLLREASVILLPVLTNEFDLHAIGNTTQQLQRLFPETKKIGLVFNRTSKGWNPKKHCSQTIESLKLPVVATLRDTRNYTQAAANGLGVYESRGAHYRTDSLDIIKAAQWCIESTRQQMGDSLDCGSRFNPDTLSLASNA